MGIQYANSGDPDQMPHSVDKILFNWVAMTSLNLGNGSFRVSISRFSKSNDLIINGL